MPEPDDGVRNRWIAGAAYAALGVALVVGLWRRPAPARPNSTPVIQEKSPDEIFGSLPSDPPLELDPTASRIVRWCTVRAVLERRCQRCHGSPTQFGAPFPLITYADTQRDYPPDSGLPLFRKINQAIRYRIMPPVTLPLEPPVLPLDAADQNVLLSWLEEGALALGGENCGPAR